MIDMIEDKLMIAGQRLHQFEELTYLLVSACRQGQARPPIHRHPLTPHIPKAMKSKAKVAPGSFPFVGGDSPFFYPLGADPPIQKLLHAVDMLCIGYYAACQRKKSRE